jgi:hypothetical protein
MNSKPHSACLFRDNGNHSSQTCCVVLLDVIRNGRTRADSITTHHWTLDISMKHVRPLLLAMLISQSLVLAQSDEHNSQVEGDSISQLPNRLELILVNQLEVAFSHKTSRNWAWSLSADLTGSLNSGSRDTQHDSTTDGHLTIDHGFSLSLTPQIRWSLNSSSRAFHFFLAAGPLVGYAYSYRYYEDERSPYVSSPIYVNKWNTNTWRAGILLTVGLAVNVTQVLSFLTTFDLSATYTKQFENYEWFLNGHRMDGWSDDTRTWNLSHGPLHFGIAVAF